MRKGKIDLFGRRDVGEGGFKGIKVLFV